ncbi:hypothetical protein NDU88_007961 [Pleurodeles waltl]|uniref:Uncharacterized protein n=1 Tax=Pleurodeles waltl TaxID=8319 RepID=A0AAV7PQS8_PLEWA|nr:hypothetical protein NDU88_007961 [Pleurodeles waltl]
MKGHYPCEPALAEAAFTAQKSTTIVMGSPLTLYAEHAVFAILQKSKSTLTTQRVSRYEVILSIPSLQVVRFTVNPATFFAHPVSDDEQVHDCANYTPEEESKVGEDPIPGSTLLFVDGSSFIDQETGIRHSGAAIVKAEQQRLSDTLQIVSQIPLLSNFSAQAAELVAIIDALQQTEGLQHQPHGTEYVGGSVEAAGLGYGSATVIGATYVTKVWRIRRGEQGLPPSDEPTASSRERGLSECRAAIRAEVTVCATHIVGPNQGVVFHFYLLWSGRLNAPLPFERCPRGVQLKRGTAEDGECNLQALDSLRNGTGIHNELITLGTSLPLSVLVWC